MDTETDNMQFFVWRGSQNLCQTIKPYTHVIQNVEKKNKNKKKQNKSDADTGLNIKCQATHLSFSSSLEWKIMKDFSLAEDFLKSFIC